MGFNNPDVPWHEIERTLSDRPPGRDPHQWWATPPDDNPSQLGGRHSLVPEGANGGDSPAWSSHRPTYEPPVQLRRRVNETPYAELHCHSNFSFLDGASHPEELAEEAAHLGLAALALTDHDGFYGVVRFAEAARAVRVPTVFGAELSLGLARPQSGEADPEGTHLLVLARDPEGYARLAETLSAGHLAGGEKGKPDYSGVDWAATHGGHWLVLTGCRKGAVPRALVRDGPAAAGRELAGLVETYGAGNVVVELCDHGDPLDSARNDALAELAVGAGVGVVATNNVHYATPARQRLATALAAVRARRSPDDMDGWPPAGGAAPPRRYGPRGGSDPRGDVERNRKAWVQIDHELAVIEALGYPGYFLVVWDIVEFCGRAGIYCQGRGSAANSAVCYALGITNVDAVALGLLFERFLSPERDGPPDIDIDIESGRREEAIQYVYERHGRRHAAQVANVISYRARSAVRDMAKALGYSPGQQDAWSKQIDAWSSVSTACREGGHDIPAPVLALARAVERAPRHLGIHSGGMVICDRPITEVCPVEWGRMADRTVLQWDKDDCAAVGLVKFDLLGLGMLEALHHCIDFVHEAYDTGGEQVDLAFLPHEDPDVYDMLCRADSIGVFQVESRAQMATLPRLRPRTFYDLVVEVALIRPGPIQGGSVHPFIRRRQGLEPVTYPHPLLEPALKRTLGVPLFQEQLMQMAMDAAGCTPAFADLLRRAMGSKRSHERMAALKDDLYAGMARNGITGEVADEIYEKLAAFANFGFAESHSISFAYLVYASAFFKRYYPAAFCAALLNAQPMGFYSPQTLVADARRHGVRVRGPDVNLGGAQAVLQPDVHSAGGQALRLGLAEIRTVGQELADEIHAGRAGDGPYRGLADLA